jgi:phosphoglycerate dehydrogenase-like enzyme
LHPDTESVPGCEIIGPLLDERLEAKLVPELIDSVVILDPNAGEIGQHLAEMRPDLELFAADVPINRLAEKRYAVITFNPGERINAFADAAWIHCSGAGVDYLLGALKVPVPLITRTVGRMGQQIAEYVLAYALNFRQQIDRRCRLQEARQWNPTSARPQYLAGSRALIFGTGAIGSCIARALTALSVRCDGVSHSGRDKPGFDAVMAASNLHSMALDDYSLVVLALPNLPQTAALIDSLVLGRMDADLLINVGRAQVLVIEDLLAAIDEGRVGRVVLDVFETEPLAEDSVLWDHPAIRVTPHVSGLTQSIDAARAFVAALEKQEAGLQPDLMVPFERGY